MEQVLTAFNLTTPPVAFLCMTYVLLNDACFGIARIVGSRLYPTTRQILRCAYIWPKGVAFASLHLAMLITCRSSCTERVLEHRHCLMSISASAVAVAFSIGADRIFEPLVGLPTPGVVGRLIWGSAITITWMALSERENMVLPLLLAMTARQASVLVRVRVPSAGPRSLRTTPVFETSTVAWWYLAILKAVGLIRGAAALNGTCISTSRPFVVSSVYALLLM